MTIDHFHKGSSAFCPEPSIPYLTKVDLLCGLIATHVDLNHGGKTGRIRTSMIYRFFSKSNQMTYDEFSFFYKFTKCQAAAITAGNAKPGGYRPRSDIDDFKINEEDFEQTKFIFKLAENQGPTPHDFVDAIGRLKFRGTSNLLRLPTIIMEFVSPEKSGFILLVVFCGQFC